MLISTANDEAYVNIYLYYSLLMENKYYRYGGCSSKEFVFDIFNCSVFYMYNAHSFCFVPMIFYQFQEILKHLRLTYCQQDLQHHRPGDPGRRRRRRTRRRGGGVSRLRQSRG